MQFRASLQLDGRTAAGIRMPEYIVAPLGGGNRPRVRVKIAGRRHQTTVARMRGESKFPASAAVPPRTGLTSGDEARVAIELDAKALHELRAGCDAA